MPIAILIAVYAILLVLMLITACLAGLMWFLFRTESRLKEMQENALDVDKPMELLKQMSESVGTLEKFLKGQLGVAQEQVKATLGLESAVTAFTRLNFGVDTPGKGHFDEIADNDEVNRIMNDHGMSRQESETELKRQRAYANLNLEG
jgi:hypothetical protein